MNTNGESEICGTVPEYDTSYLNDALNEDTTPITQLVECEGGVEGNKIVFYQTRVNVPLQISEIIVYGTESEFSLLSGNNGSAYTAEFYTVTLYS